jgi:hypothetical protein
MLGNDITGHLAERLEDQNINPGGFRTALSQGVAKNTGENFINIIVYALADALSFQDRVLVDKGLPPTIRQCLTLERDVPTGEDSVRKLRITIESDLCIFSRDPGDAAIVANAKTRLKEIFHIGTMWKLLFDMIGDEYSLKKWGLRGPSTVPNMNYVFLAADMIPKGGRRTQGPDIERPEVRNLIAVDASFFDYVFVSKAGIDHVARTLDASRRKESLFHELGCLLDLIQQRFAAGDWDTLKS